MWLFKFGAFVVEITHKAIFYEKIDGHATVLYGILHGY